MLTTMRLPLFVVAMFFLLSALVELVASVGFNSFATYHTSEFTGLGGGNRLLLCCVKNVSVLAQCTCCQSSMGRGKVER